MEGSQTVQSLSEFKQDSQGQFKRWQTEIELAENYFSDWWEKTDKIEKRYRYEDKDKNSQNKRFSILWSNSQTLQPILYSRTPVVEVERRFKDSDPLARLSSETLERATDYQIKSYEFDQTMLSCVLDYLLYGRAVARNRYIPTIKDDILTYEEVRCDYIHRKDFLHNPARKWDEVRWVAFVNYLNKDELIAKFGKIAEKVELNHLPSDCKDKNGQVKAEYQIFKQAKVYEIWDKTSRKVYYYTQGLNGTLLSVKDDFLGLKDFFPCPRPLFASLTTSTLIPIPDYLLYEDQAAELDEITSRISIITKALRVAGVYDASLKEISALLNDRVENKLVAVENWNAYMSSGGIVNGAVQFFPMKDLILVLKNLYEARDRVLGEIYETTGISDIIRGNSDPRETAKAQQLKGQFGTLRISSRQAEVQRFARDLIAIKAELVAEKFQPETIRLSSGYDYMPDALPEAFPQVIELLKDNPRRNYRIDIETDSTIAVNDQLEKENFSEYLNAIGTFFQTALPTAQQFPQYVEFMSELMLMGARKYKAGRHLESSLEAATQQFKEMMMQPPPPQEPDPRLIVEQDKMQLEREKLQVEMSKSQREAEIKQAELQLKFSEFQEAQKKILAEVDAIRGGLEIKAYEAQKKIELETRRVHAETQDKLLANPELTLYSDGSIGKRKKTRKVGRAIPQMDGSKLYVIDEEEIEEPTPIAQGGAIDG